MFSRIKDHEEIAGRGEDPVTVNKRMAAGTTSAFEDEDGNLIDQQEEGDTSANAGDGSVVDLDLLGEKKSWSRDELFMSWDVATIIFCCLLWCVLKINCSKCISHRFGPW